MSNLRKKIGTLPPLIGVLRIFLFNAQLGTGTSYAFAKLIFKTQMFILTHFTNLGVQNTVKLRMPEYYPQNVLSNNARPVVQSHPPPP